MVWFAPLIRRVPLAWHNLTHDKRRLLLAAGGIGFATLLMFMQLGFRGALFDSTVQLIERFNADLVLVNKAKSVLTARESFSRRRLIQALACPGVVDAEALYIDVRGVWKNPANGVQQPIRVIAFDPRRPVLNVPGIAEYAPRLLLPNTLLFDERSKPEFGSPRVGTVAELSGQRAEVVGLFRLGTDFADDGNVIMSDVNYQRAFFPHLGIDEALNQVDFGLLRVVPGASAVEVRKRLTAMLPDDVIVFTMPEYVQKEQIFWSQSTPIGYVFGFGTALGFVVGVIICYQILYADVSDHLPEYATLKAMGYGRLYFVGVVLQEALLLSVLGFIPGILASQVLYFALGNVTGLPLELSLSRAAWVLMLSALMCVVSGLLAMRRLLLADPAELFR